MTFSTRPALQRLAPFLPWTDGTGRAWPGWKRFPLAVPFVIVYIVTGWVLFIPNAERQGPRYFQIDGDAVWRLVYRVPELTTDPLRTIRSLATSPWINHDSLQLIYVTGLLLLFGILFELREGTLRIALIFFGTSAVGAIGAALLLHAVYPDVWDNPALEAAWTRSWTGGSAGCFGLLGAFAARARRPGLLLALILVWEGIIWWTLLRNYATAFHLSALIAGFLVTRWMLPPIGRIR